MYPNIVWDEKYFGRLEPILLCMYSKLSNSVAKKIDHKRICTLRLSKSKFCDKKAEYSTVLWSQINCI